MIKKALTEGAVKYTHSFEIHLEYRSQNWEERKRFAVHHSIQDYPEKDNPEDKTLRAWCKADAMVPWVAVACELPVSLIGEPCRGVKLTILDRKAQAIQRAVTYLTFFLCRCPSASQHISMLVLAYLLTVRDLFQAMTAVFRTACPASGMTGSLGS